MMTTNKGTYSMIDTITTFKNSSSQTCMENKKSKITQTDKYVIDSNLPTADKMSPEHIFENKTTTTTQKMKTTIQFQEISGQGENGSSSFIRPEIINETEVKQRNANSQNSNHDEIDQYFTLSSLSISTPKSNSVEQKIKKKKSTWKKFKSTISKFICPCKHKNSNRSH
ncbi:hypothetical protein NPIL_694941 [Nephila pilipes]|uniref:Uncharacterized protein n=1 Tax=Nephila pilipes TaxID=299642 RepID=A0A8X6Q2Q1_NEPPI|nr:hypothetical protein NPIL_694941 [Nephila pilipes]